MYLSISFPTDEQLNTFNYITLTSVDPWDPYPTASEKVEDRQILVVISKFTCYGGETEKSL